MDVIKLRGFHVFAYHGVYENEKTNGQNFYFDADLYVDSRYPALNDNIDDTVDYGDVSLFIRDYSKTQRFDLIETLANNLASEILAKYHEVKKVRLEVSKPEAPIPTKFESVSIEVTREWTTAYIAFGSNIGDREDYINTALSNLICDKYIRNIVPSQMIETKPYGGVEQDDFVNGVAVLETLYSPYALLERLHKEENIAGRERTVHWGPRTLDLDIIYYGDEVINTDKLIIPHADMANRTFVLKPLEEIAPNKKHPITGLTASEMLEKLK